MQLLWFSWCQKTGSTSKPRFWPFQNPLFISYYFTDLLRIYCTLFSYPRRHKWDWSPGFCTLCKLGKMVMERRRCKDLLQNKGHKDCVSKSLFSFPPRCTRTHTLWCQWAPELSRTNCEGSACRMCILKCKTGETIKRLDTSLEHINVNCSRRNAEKIYIPAFNWFKRMFKFQPKRPHQPSCK